MFAYQRNRHVPYGVKDLEFYLYLSVFVLLYLLSNELVSRLPEEIGYFAPHLVCTVVGTLFFGYTFGLATALLAPLLFYFFIGVSEIRLATDMVSKLLVIFLIFVLYRKAFVVKAWELVLAILVASFVGRLAMLFFGDSFAGIAVGYFYSVPGLVVSGLLSILLLKAMDRVERLG